MSRRKGRAVAALILLVIWVAITASGLLFHLSPYTGISKALSGTVAVPILLACLFLLVVIRRLGWRDIGLATPLRLRSLPLLWFPVLVLGLFALALLEIGLPPRDVMLLLALNTFLVGFSEEVMFRGVLLSGLRAAMPLRWAILFSTILFGLVHTMNVLVTGDGIAAIAQAGAAVFTGTMLVAVRLRTGSLWPCIIIHMLWDFLVILILTGADPGPADQVDASSAVMILAPLVMTVPNLIYGLILLRRVS